MGRLTCERTRAMTRPASKMTAVVAPGSGAAVEIVTRDVPDPGRGEVLVRIEASGVCHTDVGVARGEYRYDFAYPLTLGHEGAGTVVALGPDVMDVAVGDRVLIGWLGWSCGDCTLCRSGLEDVCERQFNPGWSVHGTMAEYAIGWARNVVRIPEGLEATEAAPLGCAGVAAYSATRLGAFGPQDLVAVFGVGGLGHLAIQYARAAGARVAAVDLDSARLDLAGDLGADHVIDASTDDPVAVIRRLGGAAASIIMAPAVAAFTQGLEALRPGGTLVVVAIPPDDAFPVSSLDAVFRGLRVVGSPGGTRQDLETVVALHASGRARLVHEVRPLAQAARAFADVHAGGVLGRVVLATG